MKCYQCGNIPAHHPKTKKKQKKGGKSCRCRKDEKHAFSIKTQTNKSSVQECQQIFKKLISYLIKRRKRKKKSRKSPVVSVYRFKLFQQKSSASLLPAVRQMCAAARTSSTSQHWLQVQIHFTPAIIQTLWRGGAHMSVQPPHPPPPPPDNTPPSAGSERETERERESGRGAVWQEEEYEWELEVEEVRMGKPWVLSGRERLMERRRERERERERQTDGEEERERETLKGRSRDLSTLLHKVGWLTREWLKKESPWSVQERPRYPDLQQPTFPIMQFHGITFHQISTL